MKRETRLRKMLCRENRNELLFPMKYIYEK